MLRREIWRYLDIEVYVAPAITGIVVPSVRDGFLPGRRPFACCSWSVDCDRDINGYPIGADRNEIVPGLVESGGSRLFARYATWAC